MVSEPFSNVRPYVTRAPHDVALTRMSEFKGGICKTFIPHLKEMSSLHKW